MASKERGKEARPVAAGPGKKQRVENVKNVKGATLKKMGPAEKSFIEESVSNHVESFNAFIDSGLTQLVDSLDPVEIDPPVGCETEPSIRIQLAGLTMGKPTNTHDTKPLESNAPPSKIFPRDCRVGHFTYSAPLRAKFELRVGDSPSSVQLEMELGRIPIMVRSKACNLCGRNPQQMIQAGEDENEVGGYFLINGNEKVMRMLIMPRANFPMIIARPSYEKRGPLYTKFACLFRGRRKDGTTQTNTLHYLTDGTCWMRFSHGREEWFLPMVAVAFCLKELTDAMFMEMLCGTGTHGNLVYLRQRAQLEIAQQAQRQKLNSVRDARSYLGRLLRVTLSNTVPRRYSNEQVGQYLVNKFLLVHTEDPGEKLASLCLMWQKLMGLVRGQLEPENQDTMSAHELLLPGQLCGMVLKEALEVSLGRVRGYVGKMTRKDEVTGRRSKRAEDFMNDSKLLQRTVKFCFDVDKVMEHFLATGNITSRSGLDLMQQTGFTVVADKLNFARFTSHFVAVHRGQYFAAMKTTTVRKLLPETFGFLCPVHTPDGAPCGLLNHIARSAKAVCKNPETFAVQAVEKYARALGVEAHYGRGTDIPAVDIFDVGWVTLDGRPLGNLPFSKLVEVADKLREAKVKGLHDIPRDLEIVCVTPDWKHLFPGLSLFLCASRMVRPVRSVASGITELIGPLEQIYLNIGMTTKEAEKVKMLPVVEEGKAMELTDAELPEQTPINYTHVELKPTEMFSMLAALTPFSNHNQSPRNMYQCQMLKQTMGTAYHCHPYRSDNKVYRIHNPQKPIVRTEMYNTVQMDTHPQGANAIVAVISYTGYDMEDSMIINKQSFERGFGHGIVYKTKIIEAGEKTMDAYDKKKCKFTNIRGFDGDGTPIRFVRDVCQVTGKLRINDDGLPEIGLMVVNGDPLCVWTTPEGKPMVTSFHDDLPAYVENVTLVAGYALPGVQKEAGMTRVLIKLRYPRNPMVGDKFSSRHGQKGVLSRLWPAEDMPFAEEGVTPDILFNPHGFPSRMTIGMLIECMAAKGASAEGKPTVDGSTFREYRDEFTGDDNNEDDPFLSEDPTGGYGKKSPPVAEYFGNMLVKHGMQRLGTTRLYSGIHGTEMETDIFMGVIYYQRLRHMVADKAQVRMRGPVDKVTNQPVKGRQRHGGIRFGEMERDSLIAHGTAYLLHDRLMRSSDYDIGFVCPMCESILTPQANAYLTTDKAVKQASGRDWECPACSILMKRPVRCHPIPIPWIFRMLSCELAAMNVRIQMKVKSRARDASLSTVERDGEPTVRIREGKEDLMRLGRL